MFNPSDIRIRFPQGADASILLEWENDESNWRVSDRTEPLTMGEIVAFIERQSSVESIYDLSQIRFMIVEAKTGKALGTIDLYGIDWKADSAYIGILIAAPSRRRKGAGYQALEKVLEQAHEEMDLEQVKARIAPDNSASQSLFLKAGFIKNNTQTEDSDNDEEYWEYFCDFKGKW